MSDQENIIRKGISQLYVAKKFDEVNGRLVLLAEHLAKKHLQKMYMKILFEQFQKNARIENYFELTKRLMKVLDDILNKDDEKKEDLRYGQAVSVYLIEIYTYIFKNVFNYTSQLSDLIIVLKTYRMQWAKRITDACFDKIKTEISKQFNNFDMDKGFSQDLISKIVNKYRKRGLKQNEVVRYMPILKKQQQKKPRDKIQSSYDKNRFHDNKSQSHSQYSNQSENDPQFSQQQSDFNFRNSIKGRKKIKVSPESQKMNIYNSSTYASGSNYPAGYSLNSGYQYPYSNPIQNYNNAHQTYEYSQYPSYPLINNAINNGQKGFYDNRLGNQRVDPRIVMKQQQKMAQLNKNNPYEYKELPSQNSQNITKKSQINFKNLLQQLYQGSLQCKQCGAYFSSQKAYEQHIYNHYTKAKNNFQIHHRKEGGKRQTLKSQQQWIEKQKINTDDLKFQVKVKNNENKVSQCMYCFNNFEVKWSDELQSWIFDDAIQAVVLDGSSKQKRIVHYECFKIFNDQDSSEQFMKKQMEQQ